MITSLESFARPFFIGIAGSGMSAIAQYLKGCGMDVSGSDRFFNSGEYNETKERLTEAGIKCFRQDGEGINEQTDLVVVSTAVEDTVTEVVKARQLGIPIMKRAELLALIASSRKTIAVGGTSGKSTTAAMLFDILKFAGKDPGIISGAGLTSIIKQGRIGNAAVGQGDWLIIEADESDGSIVLYKPEIGLLLNIDKDHKDLDALTEIFSQFKNNSLHFIVNQSHPATRKLSQNSQNDFAIEEEFGVGYVATDFLQKGWEISFEVNDTPFKISLPGKHNMENAAAACAAAGMIGVDLLTCSEALSRYEGIYRRHQLIGKKDNLWVIDDYAHNPVKCAAAIEACQPMASKVIAWFQPHGYGPTKFLKDDFVREISAALRPQDEIWMSEIFYAGGTTTKDISSEDLIREIEAAGRSAFFVPERKNLATGIISHITGDCVILLMGARDPSLEKFAKEFWATLEPLLNSSNS